MALDLPLFHPVAPPSPADRRYRHARHAHRAWGRAPDRPLDTATPVGHAAAVAIAAAAARRRTLRYGTAACHTGGRCNCRRTA